MKLKKITLTLLALSLSSYALADDAVIKEARMSAMELGKALQTELQSAMKANGPIAAINVCNTEAMPIADQISAKTKWVVGRTTLKARNLSNQPDAWEREQLESFEKRAAAGEQASSLEVYTETIENGNKVQRYMRAIPTMEGCLACHGSDLNPQISAKLDELYPNDQARGFDVGDLRGAFTLRRTISE